MRKLVDALVRSGAAVCARCGEPISPFEPWHLDHDDHDRSRYLGPSHVSCNCATAGRGARRFSRAW